MFFEEGTIEKADGSLAGDDHTWLRTIVDDGYSHPQLSLRIDLAADQFAGITSTEVLQWDDYFYPDAQTADGDRVYKSGTVTPLTEYDISRFNDRLRSFMRTICTISQPDDAKFSDSELLVRWNLCPNFEYANKFVRSDV